MKKKHKKHRKELEELEELEELIGSKEIEYFNDFKLTDSNQDDKYRFEALCIPIFSLVILLLVALLNVYEITSILKGVK